MPEKKEIINVILVGSPNVGKSAIFNNLTGKYVTVSNYPGTTVEIAEGKTRIHNNEYKVIDTPGLYSLLTITEEEKVSRSLIFDDSKKIIIHVIDTKNIERMLPLTIQLIETGLPVILVLNIMDEAEKLGLNVDIKRLEEELKVPVIPTISITGKGINSIKSAVEHLSGVNNYKLNYGNIIEANLSKIEHLLESNNIISKRSSALLLLQEEFELFSLTIKNQNNLETIKNIINETKQNFSHSISYIITQKRYNAAKIICSYTIKQDKKYSSGFPDILSKLTMNFYTGIPILLLILYFGLYKFVGQFGAGTVVDFIETKIFENGINPYIIKFFYNYIPIKAVQSLFIGEYGIITLGLRYAFAIILPIVGTFFLFFAVIEDSGYLPRLSMLIDRFFKKIGLSGRAVIPMVLGLGCDTMATIVTRTLPTKREKIIATILLALSVPCSAQLGVILALFNNNPKGLLIWFGVIMSVFLFIGYLASKVLPGEKPVFFMEIPPLRIPKLSHILIKTYARMEWYFKEILPLFIFASILIWAGQILGIFDLLIHILNYPVKLLGLPEKTSVSYLFGFFRRDYGAAGLYDMNKAGLLTKNQLLVSVVTMTLFLPCIAQFLVIIKERGLKTGISISVFVLLFAFGVGYLLNLFLNIFKIIL